jgi:hypothetical protein
MVVGVALVGTDEIAPSANSTFNSSNWLMSDSEAGPRVNSTGSPLARLTTCARPNRR